MFELYPTKGAERSLSDCLIKWDSGHCNHYQDVGLICGVHNKQHDRLMLRSYVYGTYRRKSEEICGIREKEMKRSKRMIGGYVANRKVRNPSVPVININRGYNQVN